MIKWAILLFAIASTASADMTCSDGAGITFSLLKNGTGKYKAIETDFRDTLVLEDGLECAFDESSKAAYCEKKGPKASNPSIILKSVFTVRTEMFSLDTTPQTIPSFSIVLEKWDGDVPKGSDVLYVDPRPIAALDCKF